MSCINTVLCNIAFQHATESLEGWLNSAKITSYFRFSAARPCARLGKRWVQVSLYIEQNKSILEFPVLCKAITSFGSITTLIFRSLSHICTINVLQWRAIKRIIHIYRGITASCDTFYPSARAAACICVRSHHDHRNNVPVRPIRPGPPYYIASLCVLS